MSSADWTLLQALTDQSFANGAFRQNLRPAFNAVGRTGQDAAGFATQAQAAANAAAQSLTAQLALGTPASAAEAVNAALTSTQRLYVATTGNDANPGSSPALPKRTIKAAVEAAAPGSTVFVETGAYL